MSSATVEIENCSEKFKNLANEHFKSGEYDKAIEFYSKAIEKKETAVYYANRSFANLKLECFGSALEDATKAIELDPGYIKAYYRRASSNMALGKFTKALEDYQTVVKKAPHDNDAVAKRDACKKIVRRKAFEKAIATAEEPSPLDSFDFDSCVIEESYKGPHIELDKENNYVITESFMTELMQHFKDEKRLHRKYAMVILTKINDYLKQVPSMVEIDVPDGKKFTICGDIHGQYYDLLNIFSINGQPSEDNPYLFNGDFVDRGSFSVECIFVLFGFKLLYPNHFYLSRGNHESDNMNQMYGFANEVKEKFSSKMYEIFIEIFNLLPLCHTVNSRILVMHGGLFSEENVKLSQLKDLYRFSQPPDSGLICELLWSDPYEGKGITTSKRGVGVQFGSDVTAKFCDYNKLDYIVRSHEVKFSGYEVAHDGRCITVFSAPNYCDTMNNQGAFIVLEGSHSHKMEPKFCSFKEVPHPKVKPMAFSNPMLQYCMGGY